MMEGSASRFSVFFLLLFLLEIKGSENGGFVHFAHLLYTVVFVLLLYIPVIFRGISQKVLNFTLVVAVQIFLHSITMLRKLNF